MMKVKKKKVGDIDSKDTQAFLEYSNSEILERVIEVNNKLRDK